MKKNFLILFLLVAFTAYSQDEFASSSFYADFKKIYADAQTGFNQYKGKKRKSEFEELAMEFNVKFLLPLADSGKIVYPSTGNPFVVYFFEPNKNRLKIDQRAMSLREAIIASFDKPLYVRTETVTVNERPWTNSWLFTSPDEEKKSEAIVRISIYFENKMYYLSLEIRGRT